MREVGMAYSKSSKDGILFTGEIDRVGVYKGVRLNIIEFIGGMGVPKGLPGGKEDMRSLMSEWTAGKGERYRSV